MTRRDRATEIAQRLAEFAVDDARWGGRDLLVNTIASSWLVPRVLRLMIYRAAGLKIVSPDIRARCSFVGNGKVRIGFGSAINRECYFEAVGDITIGEDSGIGTQCTLITSAHPFGPDGRHSLQAEGQPIVIGDRVWLGARVLVLPGVTIGDDVIVAAGAVVAKDCEPGGLYAGVPAKRIRELPRGPRQPAN